MNSLSAGLSVSQEYNSNIFQISTDEEEQWTTLVQPELTLLSEGVKNSLLLAAESDLEWDQRLDERDFTHGLRLSGSKDLSPNFSVSIGDGYSYENFSPRSDLDPSLSIRERFSRAEDYEREQVARLLFPEIDYSNEEYYVYVFARLDERFSEASPSVQERVEEFLSNTDERRKSWNNNIFINAQYEFARDSQLEAGYNYYIVDQRTVGVEELREHNPHLSLLYRFSPRWLTSLSWEMLASDYDLSDDRTRYNLDFSLENRFSKFNTYKLDLGYETVDYDGEQEEYDEYSAGLEWVHNFNPHLELASSIGGKYQDLEINNDERDITFTVSLNKLLRRASIYLDGNIEFAAREMDDGDWEKHSRSGGLNAGIGYELQDNLSADFSFDFEKRHFWSLFGSKEIYDEFGLNAGFSWTLKRWYVASVQYSYNRLYAQSSDVQSNDFGDYSEHQVIFGLAMNKEILRW